MQITWKSVFLRCKITKTKKNKVMLGQPKFNRSDEVRFKVADKEKVGCIVVVDKWGTFFDKSDVCYDIMVWGENCLYKHFNEKDIICKCE